MATSQLTRRFAALFSLLILALWLHSESNCVRGEKVCKKHKGEEACCRAGKHPCDMKHADDCCTKEKPTCTNGVCRSPNNCKDNEDDCCNILNEIPCLRGPGCKILNCKCCKKDTQICLLLPQLLGLVCVDTA